MFRIGTNQILLLICLLLVAGAGTYLTYFRQQSTLQQLEEEIEAKEQRRVEITTIQTELSEAETRYVKARNRWRTRYKIVPQTVSSTDIVDYLTELTQSGFSSFDVSAVGPSDEDGYSVYSFRAGGRASFQELYTFIWTIENSRPFYRIQNLELSHHEERTTDEETGRTRMEVLVDFQMQIDAIYGATEGVDPLDEQPDGREVDRLPVAQSTPRPPVPAEVLPDPSPDLDPFYPVVFEQIPPNEHGRLNVEAARLISIVEQTAVFSTGDGIERVREGDRVYLGRITEIDPTMGRVVAQLDKGGIVENVEFSLESPDPLERIRSRTGREQDQ